MRSDFCGLACIYVLCVCACVYARAADLSVLCVDGRCAVYIHCLMYSKWTRLLESFYKHFVCKTPLHFFEQVLKCLFQMCIYIYTLYIYFFAMCKVLYRSCTFFFFFLEWAKTFFCYCKKILIFVLHVTTILYTQFLFPAKEDN